MKNVLKLLLLVGIICMGHANGNDEKCSTIRLTETRGMFRSPGYPTDPYPNEARCRYVILARRRHFVLIQFRYLDLEPPRNGKRTDFVKIFDGQPGNPAQLVYYNGTRRAPIRFSSKTSRVVVRLVTNESLRRVGFFATYLQIRARESCNRPKIDNALEECSKSSIYSKCIISCERGFRLEGSAEAQCSDSDGVWSDLPKCGLIPAVVEICVRDINNANCPYTAEDLTRYFTETPANTAEEVSILIAEVGKQLVEITVEDPIQGLGPPPLTDRINCPSYVCLYDSDAGRFKYSCTAIAQALKRKWRLSESRSKYYFRTAEYEKGMPNGNRSDTETINFNIKVDKNLMWYMFYMRPAVARRTPPDTIFVITRRQYYVAI